jgi:hypothetical protein
MTDEERQQDARLETAAEFERAARELELAVHHLRVAAQRFRDKDVPRGCAHAFAAQGHLLTTQEIVNQRAIVHASKAVGPAQP